MRAKSPSRLRTHPKASFDKDIGACEWEPLSYEERQVATLLREHFGDEKFETIPPDLVICFIRGYAHEPNWAATSQRYLDQALAWRESVLADDTVASPPAGHSEFEALYQAGPVGRDHEGHAVVVERVGRVPARLFCSSYTEDSLTPHIVFNKEAARALSRQLSHEAGRRLYKVVMIVDFRGLGMQHASSDFLRLFKAYANRFTTCYPEFMKHCYVINAPSFITGLWQILRGWLDPLIVAKVEILGGEAQYTDVFAKRGIVFDRHLETDAVSWLASAAAMPRAFVPPEDHGHLTPPWARSAAAAGDGEAAKMDTDDAADAGADATKAMDAAAGRSSYVPTEVLRNVPDPGAKGVAAWLRALATSAA